MPKCQSSVKKSQDGTEEGRLIPVRIGRRKRIQYISRIIPKNVNKNYQHIIADIFSKTMTVYLLSKNRQLCRYKNLHRKREIIAEENAVVPQPPRKPYVDAWAEDPQGLYGLRLEFLTALNITPPISKWIHVFNFKCGKLELKESLEMAGKITFFTVKHAIFKSAKVEYSHPLEAVQAISMFNGRTFYGQELGVTMDKESHKDIRPHGLIDVGPGLGKNGKPVINIAEQYDRLVNKQTTQLNSLLFAEIDCDVDEPQGCDPNQNVRSENAAAAEPITGPNNRPMPSQNLVLNPINHVQAVVRDFKDRNPRPEGYVPTLSAQNILPPHAPNPIQVGVNSESLPNFPNVNVPPPHMLQNANMHWNPPPQPIAMAQNVVLQPQGFWHNNAYQFVPPVPLVPNQMWPQAPVSENGMIPNINVAQNPPAVNTAPNVPHYISDNVCVTEYPREVAFQNVPNPIMNFTRSETSTNVLNNVHPNVLNPILKPTRPEIPTTVILNNIPPSTLDVLLERLNPCGHLLSVYCPHPRRAVATFATPEQAERCFLMYNGYVAGDCAIDVTYALKQ